MKEGVEGFKKLFKDSTVEYMAKLFGNITDFGIIFDRFIWSHIQNGYNEILGEE